MVIMGGDGSFATTIKFLRTNPAVKKGLDKQKIAFVPLPFGTGNDGGQAFGWGNSPTSELWFQDLESLMRELIRANCINLTLWNATVEGELYNAAQ